MLFFSKGNVIVSQEVKKKKERKKQKQEVRKNCAYNVRGNGSTKHENIHAEDVIDKNSTRSRKSPEQNKQHVTQGI